MIGSGTGIAPFLSFLSYRKAHHSRGANWLFFGECNKATDFLLSILFRSFYCNEGFLKLTTAFSRDQKEKIYVQHRILENGKELFNLIEKGAYIYVCGSASKMAKDVENALIEITKKEAALSSEEAKKEILTLQEEKRYLKDVY